MNIAKMIRTGITLGTVMLVAGVLVGVRLAGHPATAAAPGTAPGTAIRQVGFTILQRDPIHDDDYPAQSGPRDAYGGFDTGQCTSFAAWRVTSRDHLDLAALVQRMGGGLDAKVWGPRFREQGFTVDTNPAVGSVAWSDRGTYGHVAWVQEVRADGTVLIEDYNETDPETYHSWVTNPADFTGFIHFEGRDRAQPPRQVTPVDPAPRPQPGDNPQVGSNQPIQGSGPDLQGGNPSLQGSNPGLQGGNGGSGGSSHPVAPPATAPVTPAAPPARPVFTVMNTSETPPDGVWFRNSPHTADTARITGLGVYAGEQVRLLCYATGDAVGPYDDSLWYRVENVTRPTNDGSPNAGFLNAHYVDDGMAADQVDPGVPAC